MRKLLTFSTILLFLSLASFNLQVTPKVRAQDPVPGECPIGPCTSTCSWDWTCIQCHLPLNERCCTCSNWQWFDNELKSHKKNDSLPMDHELVVKMVHDGTYKPENPSCIK